MFRVHKPALCINKSSYMQFWKYTRAGKYNFVTTTRQSGAKTQAGTGQTETQQGASEIETSPVHGERAPRLLFNNLFDKYNIAHGFPRCPFFMKSIP